LYLSFIRLGQKVGTTLIDLLAVTSRSYQKPLPWKTCTKTSGHALCLL